MLVCCEEAGPEPIEELLGTTLRTDVAELDARSTVAEPLPLGFDAESWREYLIEKISTGQRVSIGGVEVIVAGMDEPLIYEGDYPTVESVPTSADSEFEQGPTRGPDIGIDYERISLSGCPTGPASSTGWWVRSGSPPTRGSRASESRTCSSGRAFRR